MAPGLKGYTLADAKEAVRAIRDSNCETGVQTTILAMIKTMRDYEEIRGCLDNKSKKKPSRVNAVEN